MNILLSSHPDCWTTAGNVNAPGPMIRLKTKIKPICETRINHIIIIHTRCTKLLISHCIVTILTGVEYWELMFTLGHGGYTRTIVNGADTRGIACFSIGAAAVVTGLSARRRRRTFQHFWRRVTRVCAWHTRRKRTLNSTRSNGIASFYRLIGNATRCWNNNNWFLSIAFVRREPSTPRTPPTTVNYRNNNNKHLLLRARSSSSWVQRNNSRRARDAIYFIVAGRRKEQSVARSSNRRGKSKYCTEPTAILPDTGRRKRHRTQQLQIRITVILLLLTTRSDVPCVFTLRSAARASVRPTSQYPPSENSRTVQTARRCWITAFHVCLSSNRAKSAPRTR